MHASCESHLHWGEQSDSSKFLEVGLGTLSKSPPSLRKLYDRPPFQSSVSTCAESIQRNVTLDPHILVQQRANWLKKWLYREQQNCGIKVMHRNHRIPILVGARFLVLKEILMDEGYADLGQRYLLTFSPLS